MRALKSKDGDLLSEFNINNEGNGHAGFDETSPKKCLLTINIQRVKAKLEDNYP